MINTEKKLLAARILSSWVLWTVLFVLLLGFIASVASSSFQGKVSESQIQFVTDSVRRNAIQCYAIEGRFPSTQEGVKYLEETYGLTIDHKRYRVYYESFADNLVPQIRVVMISSNNTGAMTPQASATIELIDEVGVAQ